MYILIDFDLSGVQNFIYKVTEGGESKKKVAKTVRGRSFYLSLLSDFVGYAILNHFNLPYENLLISTGGKGTVAVSKSLCSDDEIHQLLSHIEKSVI